jgi:hypothetical protein
VAENATDGGFDRFVLAFENRGPEWDVLYVPKPVTEDPTGEVVPLDGDYAIEVWMRHASGVELNGEGGYRSTFLGPGRLNAGTPQITEVALAGSFEASLEWAIGTRQYQGFRVLTLTDPPRLVVDVAHG